MDKSQEQTTTMPRGTRTRRRTDEQLEELTRLDETIMATAAATPRERDEPRQGSQGFDMETLVAALSQRRENRKEFKAPSFNGEQDVEVFLKQFEDVAAANRWNEAETSLHLRLSLSGKALGCGIEDNSETIKNTLRSQFGISLKQARDQLKHLRQRKDQGLHELSAEVNKLVKLAYPNLGSDDRLDMAMDAFLSSLDNVEMQRNILASKPSSISEMIQAAEEYTRLGKNSRSKILAVTEESKPDQTITLMREMMMQQLNAMEKMTQTQAQQFETIKELTQTLAHAPRPQNSNQTRPRGPIKCYECQGPHLKRDCPKLRASQVTQQPSGNSLGPAQ